MSILVLVRESVRELSDEDLHDRGHFGAADVALGAWRSWYARRAAGLPDARLAEAVAAWDVDVQSIQGQTVHADAAGECLGTVGLGRKLAAVAGGLLMELLRDELELCVLAAKALGLLRQILDLVGVSDPLRTLGVTHRGVHLGYLVALGALAGGLLERALAAGHLLFVVLWGDVVYLRKKRDANRQCEEANVCEQSKKPIRAFAGPRPAALVLFAVFRQCGFRGLQNTKHRCPPRLTWTRLTCWLSRRAYSMRSTL